MDRLSKLQSDELEVNSSGLSLIRVTASEFVLDFKAAAAAGQLTARRRELAISR